MSGKLHFIGIDPGNSAGKVAARLAECESFIETTIPNITALAEELEVPPRPGAPENHLHVEIMEPIYPDYEGEYFVGSLAASELIDVDQDRDRDKANSDNINLITPALIAMHCQPGDKVVLGIGSPFADFNDQKAKIIDRLQRKFRVRFGKYAGSRSGQVVEFEVVLVAPYPQTAGGYIDQALGELGQKHPEWSKQNILVLDLGLGQTGVAYIENGVPRSKLCFSTDVAMLKVAQYLHGFLNTNYRRDLTIPRILDIMEAGKCKIDGEELDLIAVIGLGFEQLIKEVSKRYEASQIPQDKRDEVDAILLVGGGALTPGSAEIVSKQFNRPVLVGVNPRGSNARGFLKNAEAKYQKEMV